MKKKNTIIAAQAFILLCALALPFISLYCQEKTTQKIVRKSRQSSSNRTVPQQKMVRKKTVNPAPTKKAIQPLPQENPTIIEDGIEEDEESTTISSSANQIQAGTNNAPSSWTRWYATIAPFLLASLYKGSETGVSTATATLIKLFIKRRTALAEQQQLDVIIEALSTPAANSYFNISNDKRLKILETKQVEKISLDQQTSLYSIAGTTAYIGMINTAIPMLGIFMGTAVKIGLQMLMPVNNA